MAKKRGKPVSFDAMVKFFMHAYQIPTKRDIEKLNARLDRIEKLIMNTIAAAKTNGNGKNKASDGTAPLSASDVVLEVIKRYRDGVDFPEIQLQTGYPDKKLRNILFRLNKLEKIKRVKRGVYVSR